MKEIKVETDCGEITVQEYDDEIANGVKIFLGDTIVAMVDCYRKTKHNLPKHVDLWKSMLDKDKEMDEAIGDKLSELTGFCHKGFNFEVDGDHINVTNIEWDTNDEIPEARLLVYGPEGPDCDEPQDVVHLN